ncbi:hypothetical protein EXIGLDRAFT_838972, partial [Exidia glandulosa HHB12029]
MVSACGACQGADPSAEDRWSDWISTCNSSDVTVGSYPFAIPSETRVPPWAFMNVTETDSFDIGRAFEIAQADPQSTSSSSSSSSPSSMTSSLSTTTTSSPPSALGQTSTSTSGQPPVDTSSPSERHSRLALEVAIPIAAVAAVALLVTAALLLLRRRRRRNMRLSSEHHLNDPVPFMAQPAVPLVNHTQSANVNSK